MSEEREPYRAQLEPGDIVQTVPGPLTIEIKCTGLTEDIFDDLKEAIAASPEPHVVDRFLNEQFRFLERFNELVRLDSSSTAAGEVLLTLKKSDLYFGLLAALRTGQFDKVLGEGFIDIDHE